MQRIEAVAYSYFHSYRFRTLPTVSTFGTEVLLFLHAKYFFFRGRTNVCQMIKHLENIHCRIASNCLQGTDSDVKKFSLVSFSLCVSENRFIYEIDMKMKIFMFQLLP